MPIPKPTKDETKGNFITRCMSNDSMKKDYEDTDQRLAVCHSNWDGKGKPVVGGDIMEEGKVIRHDESLPEGKSDQGSPDKTKPKKIHVVHVDKDARRESTIRGTSDLMAKAVLAKATKNDPGFVQGYAVHWDNVDLGGEIMRKGAFVKTIQERVAAGKVKLMSRHFAHGGDVLECIGTITEAKEDDTGLWFNAVFSKRDQAQDIRTLILEGHVDTCSVGYIPVRWNWLQVPSGDDGSKTMRVLEHLECKFFEVTITVVPMNEKAKLTAAKSLTEVASKVKDIATKLGVTDTEAPSDKQKAAILQGAFGSEAEAKALKESLVSLCGELDRLLMKSKPKNTSSKRNEAVLRQRTLDMKKRRLAMGD